MPTPYQNSLFSCCTPFTLASFGLCLKASFFPCVVSGRNHYRIKHGNDHDYHCCNWWCASYCGLALCAHWGWTLQVYDRLKMKEKYEDLGEFGCEDCCASWCCPCCEVIQTKRELDYRKLDQNGAAGYQQSEPNMVPAPQM